MTGLAQSPVEWPHLGLPEVRPLVVPTVPADDESLVGIVASATEGNVLGRIDVILREVGLDLLKPGLIGQHAAPLLDRLAAKIGCDVETLRHRTHPYVDEAAQATAGKSANWHWLVRWGSGQLHRHQLLLERRRIAPKTLETSSHHRWQWLCSVLPYCPLSLERLVDTCGACGKPLGWSNCRGVGTCEHCRAVVMASPEAPLPDHLAEDYRRFASLISPTPGEREEVLSTLHSDLQSLAATSLIAFILRAGWLFGTRAAAPWSFTPTALDQAAVGEAVAVGMGLLRDWPNAFRSSMTERMRGVTGDERGETLKRIRQLGDRNAPPDLATLVRAALPEAFEMTQRAMSLDQATMLSCDICRTTGIDVDDVRKLDEAGILTAIETRTGERRHVQYPAKEVEQFNHHRRGSERATRMAEALGLPRYAIEQLLGLGEVTHELHPGVLLLDENLRLVTASRDAFFSDVNKQARSDEPPEGVVTLWNASRSIGGRAKDWGATLSRLRQGHVRFWLIPDEQRSLARHSKFVRRVLVVPTEVIPTLAGSSHATSASDTPIANVISQVDAAELLNIDAVQMKRVSEARDLVFEGKGKALWASKKSVLALAEKHISSPELAFLVGGYGPVVTKMLYRRTDIRRGSAGWLREDVQREIESLRAEAKQVVRSWRGPGGKLNLTARSRKRNGQRGTTEGE